jgi:hypothetical protein
MNVGTAGWFTSIILSVSVELKVVLVDRLGSVTVYPSNPPHTYLNCDAGNIVTAEIPTPQPLPPPGHYQMYLQMFGENGLFGDPSDTISVDI